MASEHMTFALVRLERCDNSKFPCLPRESSGATLHAQSVHSGDWVFALKCLSAEPENLLALSTGLYLCGPWIPVLLSVGNSLPTIDVSQYAPNLYAVCLISSSTTIALALAAATATYAEPMDGWLT